MYLLDQGTESKRFLLFLRVTYNTRRDYRVPLSVYFGIMRIFSKKFFQRVPLLNFRSFATEWMLKNPKGSPFQFFRNCETFKIFFKQTAPFPIFLMICEQWMKNLQGSPWRINSVQLLCFSGTVEENILTF